MYREGTVRHFDVRTLEQRFHCMLALNPLSSKLRNRNQGVYEIMHVPTDKSPADPNIDEWDLESWHKYYDIEIPNLKAGSISVTAARVTMPKKCWIDCRQKTKHNLCFHFDMINPPP